jgi:hypothetical protein
MTFQLLSTPSPCLDLNDINFFRVHVWGARDSKLCASIYSDGKFDTLTTPQMANEETNALLARLLEQDPDFVRMGSLLVRKSEMSGVEIKPSDVPGKVRLSYRFTHGTKFFTHWVDFCSMEEANSTARNLGLELNSTSDTLQ